MADLEEHNPEFEITVTLKGESKALRVQPNETSDGVEYYNCSDGEGQITQVRMDEDGWHQLWGDLDQEDVDEIGSMIEQKTI